MSTLCDMMIRSLHLSDAELLHQLYQQTPGYFDIISIEMPNLNEVRGEIGAAMRDPHRYLEIVFAPDALTPEHTLPKALDTGIIDPVSGRHVVGYLDYKLNYPDRRDATINLLMLSEKVQSQGLGHSIIKNLEMRLEGRVRRILTGIYGYNLRAKRFWENLGYHFAIDAKPILEWYAKEI
ncbi:MAG: GNAT family N-acetyltransferase [Deinococcales bacterium]